MGRSGTVLAPCSTGFKAGKHIGPLFTFWITVTCMQQRRCLLWCQVLCTAFNSRRQIATRLFASSVMLTSNFSFAFCRVCLVQVQSLCRVQRWQALVLHTLTHTIKKGRKRAWLPGQQAELRSAQQ